MIELDPWKRIDLEKEFDESETIFEFSGSVSKADDHLLYPRHFSFSGSIWASSRNSVQYKQADKKIEFL